MYVLPRISHRIFIRHVFKGEELVKLIILSASSGKFFVILILELKRGRLRERERGEKKSGARHQFAVPLIYTFIG